MAAGLIPSNLLDILSTPWKYHQQNTDGWITGARVLTADEYHKMMEVKYRKEKEGAELKKKRGKKAREEEERKGTREIQ